MRTALAAALLLMAAIPAGAAARKPVSIAVQPLGDRQGGVVARVSFRFANPRAITVAGLFLEGSFRQAGRVTRNFSYAVPRENDRMIWSNIVQRNGKIVRRNGWALLPDQRNEMATTQTFAEGEVEVEARLVLESDFGDPPVLVAEATQTFTVAKTNRPLPPAVEDVEEEVHEAAAGAVTLRDVSRNPWGLFAVSAQVLPPVTRVEFRADGKPIMARNAPPYSVELDLGESPEGIAVRAIGYDDAGLYVDADAFVVSESDALAVTITRTDTPDGLSHFKLSVRSPRRTRVKRVVLYAGDTKLKEWDRPPFMLSVPTTSLAGAGPLRASVVDESGAEASDVIAEAARPK